MNHLFKLKSYLFSSQLRIFSRSVSQLSPIADKFNFPTEVKTSSSAVNPLFRIDGLNNPHYFKTLTKNVVEKSDSLLSELFSDNRQRNTVQILDDLSNSICKVADMADCLRILHPNATFRECAAMCCRSLSDHVERLNTNEQLYDVSVKSLESGNFDEIDFRVLKLFVCDFQQSGVHLKNQHMYKEFIESSSKVFEYGEKFFNNSHTPYIDAFGKEHFWPSLYTGDAVKRRESYLEFYKPIYNQEYTLKRLLFYRHKAAKASGFKNYSSRALANTMVDNVEDLDHFLEKSLRGIQPSANSCVDLIHKSFSSIIDQDTPKGKIGPWDIPYIVLMGKSYGGIDRDIFKYLSLGSCMQGVSMLAECLFDLVLVPGDVLPGETYHSDVIKVDVYRKNASQQRDFVGSIYCDFFQREGKPFQDCHYTIRGGKYIDLEDRYQTPIVCLHLNFAKGDEGKPTLLDFDQVENLFHEWGHAIHSMLATTRYQHVTGTRCSTDLAEIPSTLFELLAMHPLVINEYARHWKTGKPLEDGFNKFSQINSSRYFGQSVEISQQLVLAMLDQQLHRDNNSYMDHTKEKFTSFTLHQELSKSNLAWEYTPVDGAIAYTHRFSHLYNYGGKYHAYLLARASAYLIFHRFFAKDPWNSSGGQKINETFLKHGGEFEGFQMISKLLETQVDANHLSRHLVDEINEREEVVKRLYK